MILAVVAQSSYAEVSATVLESVSSLQTPSPLTPAGVANPKGNIGYILANIFGTGGTSLGKIQGQYLDTSGISGISQWTSSGSSIYYA